MESNPIRIRITVCILILAGTVSIEAYSRGYNSYRSTVNGQFTSYSASPDIKEKSEASTWKTTTAGAAAYLIISRLAVPGAYYRDEYVGVYGSDRGYTCENNEDFNGTMLGKFQCPMNGFEYLERYCCGPGDFEYCCYMSTSVLLAICIPLSTVLLIIIAGFCAMFRVYIKWFGWPCDCRCPCKKEDDTNIVCHPSEPSPNDLPQSMSLNCDTTQPEQAVKEDDVTVPPAPACPIPDLGDPVSADAATPPPPPPPAVGAINVSSRQNLRFSPPPPSYESVESNKLPTIVS